MKMKYRKPIYENANNLRVYYKNIQVGDLLIDEGIDTSSDMYYPAIVVEKISKYTYRLFSLEKQIFFEIRSDVTFLSSVKVIAG